MDWKFSNDKTIFDIKEKGQLVYLSFRALEDTGIVKDAFSTRYGGASSGKFSTMNFSYSRGDRPEAVLENYQRMAEVLDVDINKMVVSYQTHTVNVKKVEEKDFGMGVVRERSYKDVDGLITNIPGVTLVTFYADCVPLYIVDTVRHAIGLSHSGWRGTVKRMGEQTIKAMNSAFGTKPEDVTVCIGPSICASCYEIGNEVAEEFLKAFGHDVGEEILSHNTDNSEKYHLDLWRANQIIFKQAGVPENKIYTTNLCTKCNSEHLFSYRSQGENRGNMAAFLSLK